MSDMIRFPKQLLERAKGEKSSAVVFGYSDPKIRGEFSMLLPVDVPPKLQQMMMAIRRGATPDDAFQEAFHPTESGSCKRESLAARVASPTTDS